MEEKEQVSNEALFMGLVINLHATTMMALGKIMNPLSQKIERNLEQARFTIDMLGMLEAKTQGNRTEEETKTLKHILTELRLNYVDELEKDRLEGEKPDKEKLEKEAAVTQTPATDGLEKDRLETEKSGQEGKGTEEGEEHRESEESEKPAEHVEQHEQEKE